MLGRVANFSRNCTTSNESTGSEPSDQSQAWIESTKTQSPDREHNQDQSDLEDNRLQVYPHTTIASILA